VNPRFSASRTTKPVGTTDFMSLYQIQIVPYNNNELAMAVLSGFIGMSDSARLRKIAVVNLKFCRFILQNCA